MAKASGMAKDVGSSTIVGADKACSNRESGENEVMVHSTQRAWLAQYSPYIIDVDRERNCYSCGGFGHLV